MDFKMPKGKWEDAYRFIYFPPDPADLRKTTESTTIKSILKNKQSPRSPREGRSSSKGAKSPAKTKKKSESPKKAGVLDTSEPQPHPIKLGEKFPEKPPVRPEERAKIPWYRAPAESVTSYSKNLESSVTKRVLDDQKGSLLSLEYVLGFSGRRCPDVKWSQDDRNLNEVLFASGNLVVAYDTQTAEQRFFMGNTSPVCCLDISKDGTRVAVAQEDRDSCVKVFDFGTTRCLGTIPVKMKEIRSVSFSWNRKYIAIAGVDTYNRDILTIWDVEALEIRNKV